MNQGWSADLEPTHFSFRYFVELGMLLYNIIMSMNFDAELDKMSVCTEKKRTPIIPIQPSFVNRRLIAIGMSLSEVRDNFQFFGVFYNTSQQPSPLEICRDSQKAAAIVKTIKFLDITF